MAARRSLFFGLRQLHGPPLIQAPPPLEDQSVLRFTVRSPKFLSSSSSETPSVSWLQRLKGFFVGQESVPTADQKPLSPSAPPVVPIVEQFDLESFANELKSARAFGKMTQFGRGLPRGGEAIAARSLQKQEDILRKLATYSPDGQRLETHQKREVAKECGCTPKDVDDVLSKYEWAREANAKMVQLKAEGKPLPKSLDEVEKMMGRRWKAAASVNLSKDSQPSRNSLCFCGSGRKYKRVLASVKEKWKQGSHRFEELSSVHAHVKMLWKVLKRGDLCWQNSYRLH